MKFSELVVSDVDSGPQSGLPVRVFREPKPRWYYYTRTPAVPATWYWSKRSNLSYICSDPLHFLDLVLHQEIFNKVEGCVVFNVYREIKGVTV